MSAPAFFTLPKDYFDALLRSNMSAAELKLTLLVLRQTEGHYKRSSAEISLGIFYDRTGFSERHIQKALKALVVNRVLFKVKDADWGHGARYAVNYEYWNWKGKFRVSRSELFVPMERLQQQQKVSRLTGEKPTVQGVKCSSPTESIYNPKGEEESIKEESYQSVRCVRAISNDGRDGIDVKGEALNACGIRQVHEGSGGAPCLPALRYTDAQMRVFLRNLSLFARRCQCELNKKEKPRFFADVRRMLQEGENPDFVMRAGCMLISQGLHLDMMSWAIEEVKYNHKDDKPGVTTW